MTDITHCHNARPLYQNGNDQITEWSNPSDVRGTENAPSYPTYHPVVMDIETTAETPQRPMLVVAADMLSRHIIILYDYGRDGFHVDESDVREHIDIPDDFRITLDNCSQSNVADYIFRPLLEYNEKMVEQGVYERKSLVCHNATFDIPMLGTPNDELLDSEHIPDHYEQCFQIDGINIVGHRAGQFGHIFGFYSENYAPYKPGIPIGDTQVAAKALWLPGKLDDLIEKLELGVVSTDSYGTLDMEHVAYCVDDVKHTVKAYDALNKRLAVFGDGQLPVEKVYSSASIGKYVLRTMGYQRPGYEQQAVNVAAESYFGGHTEARDTGRVVHNVRYLDILSQYPTVSALTRIWRYMRADTVRIDEIDPNDLPTNPDLTQPDSWPSVADYYVEVRPNGDTLPVRTTHLEDTTKVVMANVDSDDTLTYHYMDVLASRLRGSDPEIVRAYKMSPVGTQDLCATSVADVTIRPSDNVMARCIQARKKIQKAIGGKNERTLTLKIVANSLYGTAAERIVKDDAHGDTHDVAAENGFYNPHVAATITAGGRLQIALGEKAATDHGGDLVYCDTDSFTVPSDVAEYVIETFDGLNPYDGHAGTLDVCEDEHGIDCKMYAVDTKKYVLMADESGIDADSGDSVQPGDILAAKEHGLGNYSNLREPEIIKQLWATIMEWDGFGSEIRCDILPPWKLDEPVIWQFGASTRSMRVFVDKFTDDHVRYGDWIEATLSKDTDTRYLALNMTEKSGDDLVLRVKTDGDGSKPSVSSVPASSIDTEQTKLVSDVVFTFVCETATSDERPDVTVTNKKIVTKEATSRVDIFLTQVKNFFEFAVENAADILD